MATLAIGVTVPSASMRTGTGFFTAIADIDRHHPGCGRLPRSLRDCAKAPIISRTIGRSAHGQHERPGNQPTASFHA